MRIRRCSARPRRARPCSWSTVASGAPLRPPVPARSSSRPSPTGRCRIHRRCSPAQNGVLKADVTLLRAGPPGSGESTLFGGKPLYSAATLPPPSPSGGASPPSSRSDFAAGYAVRAAGRDVLSRAVPGADAAGPAGRHRRPDLPRPACQTRRGHALPEGALLTNLHTHGLIVSPLDEGDNVYRTMMPNGRTAAASSSRSNHQPGVDWYHAHRHGYVADQVYGGLAGILQIGDPLDPWPQYKGKYAERYFELDARAHRERTSRPVSASSTDPSASTRTAKEPSPRTAPRGEVRQRAVQSDDSIRPGETQIWTFTGMNRERELQPGHH